MLHTVFYEKLTFVYIELNQFQKGCSELITDEDRWLYALGNMGSATECPTELSGPIFEGLFESAKISKLDSMKIHTISAKLADEGIRNGELAYATDKGLKQGREEGREEGRFLLISEMLRNGADWDSITRFTGISLAEYQKLEAGNKA